MLQAQTRGVETVVVPYTAVELAGEIGGTRHASILCIVQQ